MNLRSVGWLSWIALATLVACKPAAHGNCTSNSDCRDGSFCTLEGVCVAPSGTCDPICGGGQLCSFSACVSLKPSLSLQLASGALISPSLSQVTVHVEAAAGIPLHTLVVEAL